MAGKDEQEMISVIRAAVEVGVTLFDSAESTVRSQCAGYIDSIGRVSQNASNWLLTDLRCLQAIPRKSRC